MGMRNGLKENMYVSDYFQATVQKYPNKVAILFEERKMTFKELDELSNKIANLLLATTKLQHGDCVALLMENCPEYLATSLALSKIGVTGAFINYNLRGKSLSHCINVCHCSGIVFSSVLSEALSEVLPSLDPSIREMLYSVGGDSSISDANTLDNSLKTISPASPPPVQRKLANGEHLSCM